MSIKEKVGKIMSFPWRKYYEKKGEKLDKDRNIIVTARNAKGAPQFDEKGKPTEAFKYQTAAEFIKAKRIKNYTKNFSKE